MTVSPPPLDGRDLPAIAEDLDNRIPAFVPGWRPGAEGPGRALLSSAANLLTAAATRVDRAPAKHQLAFWNLLGLGQLAAMPARTPLVFTALPTITGSRVPAGTQAVGTTADGSEVVFETASDVGLAGANLAEVVSVWPATDSYADHSAAAREGTPFETFSGLQPIPHHLYLGHGRLLALSGRTTIEVQIDLRPPGAIPLDLAWEYFDGEQWRGFRPFSDNDEPGESFDGTVGLSQHGLIRLVGDCTKTEPTTIHGHETYWIRARTTAPIPPDRRPELPLVNRATLRTVTSNQHWSLGIDTGAPASGTARLDFTVRDAAGELITDEQGIVLNQSRLQVRVNGVTTTPIGSQRHRAEVPQRQPANVVALDTGDEVPTLDTTVEVTDRNLDIQLLLGSGQAPDTAYHDSFELDLSTTFFPFGPAPQPGSVFAIKADEVLAKPGADATLFAKKAEIVPQSTSPTATISPILSAEYWNGDRWADLGLPSSDLVEFFTTEPTLRFTVPADVEPTTVGETEGRWIRFRVVSRTFANRITVQLDSSNSVSYLEPTPPSLSTISLGYEYRSPAQPFEAVVSYSDFAWADHTLAARFTGEPFSPFEPLGDPTPSLYLGFDGPLPADVIGLLADLGDEYAGPGPELVWEQWAGTDWLPLPVVDGSESLTVPGVVEVVWPGSPPLPEALVIRAEGTDVELGDERDAYRFLEGDRVWLSDGKDGELGSVAGRRGRVLQLAKRLNGTYDNATVSGAGLARFGTPRTWMRVRYRDVVEPASVLVNGLHLNAVWAEASTVIPQTILGSSDGEPNQSFFIRSTPLVGETIIEVRELEGPRAEIELPRLAEEVTAAGIDASTLTVGRDPATGRAVEVWVPWSAKPSLGFSGPGDRHVLVEPASGRVMFGDGAAGALPPAGRDNVRLAVGKAGGGAGGNVAAGTVTQIRSGVAAESVTNPRPARRGVDAEPSAALAGRLSQVMRHRMRAVTIADYEGLAREASPEVALARAVAGTDADGNPAPGAITIIIAPAGQDPRPVPSFELRQSVTAYVAERCPAEIAADLAVIGPTYAAIGVRCELVPTRPQDGGPAADAVTAALSSYLHPLSGGPDGAGWPFGRDVYLSDVAAVVEAIPGVGHIPSLHLLVGGVSAGFRAEVSDDRIVAAGPIEIHIGGPD